MNISKILLGGKDPDHILQCLLLVGNVCVGLSVPILRENKLICHNYFVYTLFMYLLCVLSQRQYLVPSRKSLNHVCVSQNHFCAINVQIIEHTSQSKSTGGGCNAPEPVFLTITKTRLFKYIENFTSKNRKFSGKKLWNFLYFCSIHRLWVLVRTASARRF